MFAVTFLTHLQRSVSRQCWPVHMSTHCGAVNSLSQGVGSDWSFIALAPTAFVVLLGLRRSWSLQRDTPVIHYGCFIRVVCGAGAGSLQPSRIAGLVRTAICSMPHPVSRQESIRSLLSLPAAPSMDQATLSSLLQAAVQVTDHAAAMIICEQVPGVQLLEASVIDMLLCTAIQQSNSITFLAMDEEHGGDAAAEPPLIKMLCELPAAASVNAQPLIRLAVQQRAVKLLPCLCKRLQRLDLSGLSQLLAEAVQLREYSSVKHLLAAQAAQQLGTERIVELLESAVRDGQEVAAGALVELPGAQQLQVDAVAKLLQGAGRAALHY